MKPSLIFRQYDMLIAYWISQEILAKRIRVISIPFLYLYLVSNYCTHTKQIGQSGLLHYICYKKTSCYCYDNSNYCMTNSRGIKCKKRKIEFGQHSKDGMEQIDGQGVCSNK